MIELGANRYGKAAIRLVRVARGPDGDRVRDLTVAIALEGDFEAAHTDGDNSLVIATDTMKNTAYAFAKDHLDGPIEDYGRALAEHFLAEPQVDSRDRQHPRSPLGRDRRRRHARPRCVRARRRGDPGRDRQRDRAAARVVEAGVEDLVVMKTTPLRVQRLPARPVHDAARDRRPADGDEGHRHLALRRARTSTSTRRSRPSATTLLEVFADHDSPSVQTSIWIMARAILERHEEVEEVRMVLPNLHHWLVDLSPFGLENDREIYTPTTEPHGLIEATVRRGEG